MAPALVPPQRCCAMHSPCLANACAACDVATLLGLYALRARAGAPSQHCFAVLSPWHALLTRLLTRVLHASAVVIVGVGVVNAQVVANRRA